MKHYTLSLLLCFAWHYAAADEQKNAANAERDAMRAMKNSLEDYRLKHLGLELPRSAEALLLERLHAKKIVDVHELQFQRRNYCDYLAVSVSLLVDGGFESVYHHSFVLRKELHDDDWSRAKLYRGAPRGLHTMTDDEFTRSLREVPAK
jgi:hypothetical protein